MKLFFKGFFSGERGNVRGISLIVAFCIVNTLFTPAISQAQFATPDEIANSQCVVQASNFTGFCASPLGVGGVCISGVCVSTAVLLPLAGGLALTAAMGGSSGSSGGGTYGQTSLTGTGGYLAGCSGTPYISATPSSNPCAVYIPTSLTAGSSLTSGNISANQSVSSMLLNNTFGTSAGASSSVSSVLLNTATSATNASQTSAGSQSSSSSLGGASTTSASSVSSTLLNYLSGGTGGASYYSYNTGASSQNVSSGNVVNAGNSSSLLQGNSGANVETRANASAKAAGIPAKLSGVQAGEWGDIEVSAAGVTITAGGHETDGRKGIGGFYGYDMVYGIQPRALARGMCAARPWGSMADGACIGTCGRATTSIVPPSFFDSICDARGYIATTTTASSAITSTGSSNKKTGTVSATSTASTSVASSTSPLPPGPVRASPPPRIDIYAMPPRVRIGSRSTIYWSTRGVISCAVSSPDGSFSEDDLSGAASTVALYENTAFTITCEKPDGSDVSKSVTVATSD